MGDPSARHDTVRYFSPEAEVSSCGHATIASGVLLGELQGPATYVLDTGQGPVPVEVPATGAAAAAFGAYLRTVGLTTTPSTVEIEQGTDMGRPSHLSVHIPPGDAGIEVSGTAVDLTP